MNVTNISDNYAVAPQIDESDIAAIAAQGFVTIICNRPDGEDPGQPSAAAIAAACERAGIAFHHVPVAGMPMASEAVKEHREIIERSTGPVLGYCRSGQRSSIIWQASA